MKTGSDGRAFLSPIQVMRRFGMSRAEYDTYLSKGLPTYYCAGVTRHPIDEIYTWCESHRIVLQDQNDICSRKQLKRLLGISDKDLENWEAAGLPRIATPLLSGVMFEYNKNDVIDWLKSQQNNTVEV